MSDSLGQIPSAFGPGWLLRARMNEGGEVITFYSYKGGTGRSLALVNCAGLIAQNLPSDGKPILLVDFDLEAPGLHRYLASYLPAALSTGQLGVLELFEELSRAVDREPVATSQAGGNGGQRLDDLSAARIVDALNLERYVQRTGLNPVFLLQAGRFDESYDRRLSGFQWEALFDKAPGLFRCLAERLAREYAFVFIDSRTGLSDTTGVCTTLLPDVLVMVFTPNSQSLTGVEHLVRKAVDYRATSSDLRPLRVYPMPSRVDIQVEHFRRVWRMGEANHPLFGTVLGYEPMFVQVFKDVFGVGTAAEAPTSEYFDVVQIPHSSDYAYGERLCFTAAASSDSLSLRGAYEQFLPWLMTGAQPWQRPAEMLVEQQAERLLADLGADSIPTHDAGWPAWFDHLSAGVNRDQEQLVAQASRLSDERRANMNLAIALALAHRGELRRSILMLDRESGLSGIASCYSALALAMVQLLALWRNILPPVDLATADRLAWLNAAERLLGAMRPARSLTARWADERVNLTDYAPWLALGTDSLQAVRDSDLVALGEDQQDGMLKSLEIGSELSVRDPSNILWQHELSMSHVQIGHALIALGDIGNASAAYLAAVEMCRQLAEREPNNAQLQVGLALSYVNLGARELGQPTAVRRSYYQRGRDVLEKLGSREVLIQNWIDDLDHRLEQLSTDV